MAKVSGDILVQWYVWCQTQLYGCPHLHAHFLSPNSSDYQTIGEINCRRIFLEADVLSSELKVFSVPFIFCLRNWSQWCHLVTNSENQTSVIYITEGAIAIPELYNVCLLVCSSLQLSMKLLCPCWLDILTETGRQMGAMPSDVSQSSVMSHSSLPCIVLFCFSQFSQHFRSCWSKVLIHLFYST